ncbi:kelch motif-containing protein [Dactylosporangium fulvum]|uniref:Galactose oxidase early set domain-containing protein n=1 Tax=Dactylosporangium fulvum TaxID=53359 RepID=A0ABY5W1H3_9ACTN|nr:galactose oxidase early set domain-containing protein [Dactylosporangium fulvum]UWP83280.1 galactose oxidase early set domain-containing protein [Dactylosporangium fulvum]
MTPLVPHWIRRKVILPVAAAAVLGGANIPPLWSAVTQWQHERLINSANYKELHGFWQVVELPKGQRVNAIHAALLPSGKILLIAGSGNDRAQFDAGTFKTLVFDPASGATKFVPTPTDLFCAGHTFLPDGKLLVAGGTLRYELLEPAVKRAGGTMTVKNESPDGDRSFPKGTTFVATDGKRYIANDDFVVPSATKTEIKGRNGGHTSVTVTAGQTAVWVDAAEDGTGHVRTGHAQYHLDGLTGVDAQNIYGIADKIDLEKQDYQGRKETYEFNPFTEQYERVADMHEKRWYPTLTGLPDGSVLAVSGLDGSGEVVDGTQNEVYDPKTKQWTVRRDLDRYFPTYPALFQTDRAGVLFYSGSNAGYGPADKGRDPGFWNLADNSFEAVPGLRDADLLETSMSTWAGPVQDQTVMVVGGGGVGESSKSSRRIDIIKLNEASPRFQRGPDLPEGTRYPNLVQLPDDTVLITNGSSNYRGRNGSDNHTARIYHPDSNTLTVAADPHVGRNYHSAAVLLPDGRVLTVGSDPLFRDKKNTISGTFEQRLEIYTPPYLFRGSGPVIGEGPTTVRYGQQATFTTLLPDNVRSARLIRPSAATHMLNTDQRSVALDVEAGAGSVTVTVPSSPALMPPGPYMLFLVDKNGVPSQARWVQVG